jgi:hypothetical protein
VSVPKIGVVVALGFFLSVFLPPIYALEKDGHKGPAVDKGSEAIIGVWEIARTKEPGKPYREGYNGRPFVSIGPSAFTLVLEYRKNGTFRRVSRVGEQETVQEGSWILSGHELRHKRKGASDEEVMYVRFDNPNQYTSLEVFETTADPGLFAQFRRSK